MVYLVLAFLFVAILFYLVFGGADFGAGILEFFSSEKNKKATQDLTYKVIGPVWEANHVWLILVMVILWVGFPYYFQIVIVQLHIPLTFLLIGIIGRGTSFIFRHYDAFEGETSQKLYNSIFRISSLFTPFFIGLIGGSMISGNLHSPQEVTSLSFEEAFIFPWSNGTALSVGVFAIAICAFISSVFLIGETTNLEIQKIYRRRSIVSLIIMVLSGALVFLFDLLTGGDLLFSYFQDWRVISLLAASGILLIILFRNISKTENIWWVRIVAGTEIVFVLGAWVIHSFPNLITISNGNANLLSNLPPESVHFWLGMALIGGSIFILPGLYHLFRMFGLLDFSKHK